MNSEDIPDNPYVLLTPGPLSTTKSVRAAMLRDWCTWDDEYNAVVQGIRSKLVSLATRRKGYTSVLMQGSGTFCVEAAIGTAVPRDGKILVLANGAYGERMAMIAVRLGIPARVVRRPETEPLDPADVREEIARDGAITHAAFVHCETTTGMLNPLPDLAQAVRESGRVLIVDGMSSFGGIPIDVGALDIDFLVSSANKCIQGVPGFGFVIARTTALEGCAGRSRSLSLDLHDQWREMEEGGGKWRFTSPTHVVHAFSQALAELGEEGGVASRFKRYTANQRALVTGMRDLDFDCLLPPELHSPVITSFISPGAPGYTFPRFYSELKQRGFVIYPGKVSKADTFRIGTIGEVRPHVIKALLCAVSESMYWRRAERSGDPAPPEAVSL